MNTPLALSVCDIARVPECPRPMTVTIMLEFFRATLGLLLLGVGVGLQFLR